MTRNVLVLLAGLAALCACAPQPGPQDSAADLEAVKAQSAAWFEHVARGDAAAAASLHAADAVVLPDKAPAVVGRAAFREFLAGMLAEVQAAGLTIESGADVSAGVSGDLGWVSGTYAMVDSTGATVETGKYLSVHRRTADGWPYIRDIWNADSPPTGPEGAEAH